MLVLLPKQVNASHWEYFTRQAFWRNRQHIGNAPCVLFAVPMHSRSPTPPFLFHA
jgi:hypothetical protein